MPIYTGETKSIDNLKYSKIWRFWLIRNLSIESKKQFKNITIIKDNIFWKISEIAIKRIINWKIIKFRFERKFKIE
jgi:hypothetical protein